MKMTIKVINQNKKFCKILRTVIVNNRFIFKCNSNNSSIIYKDNSYSSNSYENNI